MIVSGLSSNNSSKYYIQKFIDRCIIRKNYTLCLFNRWLYGKKLTIKNSFPFITGMGFRSICDYVFDEHFQFDVQNINQFDGMKFFVQPEFLQKFSQILPKITKKFFIFSHNSDMSISSKFNEILTNDNLLIWYAQNVAVSHEKLISIPIGIANQSWPHGNIKIINKVIEKNILKNRMVICAIDTNTNSIERNYCLEHIHPCENLPRMPYEKYLTMLASSYFTVSPEGNGIDCHKTWEALYLKTIPVVTRSINIDFYTDYPILVIDDWREFNNIKFNEKLYHSIWQNFDSSKLYIDNNSYNDYGT